MASLEHTKKTYALASGDKMPAIGLGTWQSGQNGETKAAVQAALEHGYRYIDTALAYGNEREVGEGMRASAVPRDQIWLTTKLDNPWHHRVAEGLHTSLRNLGVDYVDLYLMHWPSPTDPDDVKKHVPGCDFVKTWAEMQKLLGSGKVRNIGVSNFSVTNLRILLSDASTKTKPAVNQIELHPYNPSPKLVQYCKDEGIHVTGYSCLGSAKAGISDNPAVKEVARAKGKTEQQIMLLWGIQHGWDVIPKSVTAERIRQNFDIDGVELTADELRMLDFPKEDKYRYKVCGQDWLPNRGRLPDLVVGGEKKELWVFDGSDE